VLRKFGLKWGEGTVFIVFLWLTFYLIKKVTGAGTYKHVDDVESRVRDAVVDDALDGPAEDPLLWKLQNFVIDASLRLFSSLSVILGQDKHIPSE
jgi:hypothetical protein